MAANYSSSSLPLLVLFVLLFALRASAVGGGGLLGGWQPIRDVESNKKVQDLGRFSVDEYNRKNHHNLKFLKVVKGQYQVVAGTNYNLTVATVDGGVQQNYDALLFVSLKNEITLNSFTPSAVRLQPLGRWQPIPDVASNKKVQDLGRFSVDKYNRDNHSSLKFLQVVKGQYQVVSGTNYNLTVATVDGSVHQNYDALLSVSVQNEITFISLKPSLLLGGWKKISDVASNKKVQELGRFSVDEFNRENHHHLKFLKVVKGQYQVVSGTNYNLTVATVDVRGVHGYYDALVYVSLYDEEELKSFTPSAH